tara:strand:- start:2345 stop:3004 length:660 start_codon:yes stop_codon:yes gene_type:complete
MSKIAVILSGCGVYDGSEVHEAVLTLLYLSQANQEVTVMAPNINQMHVINHANGEVMNENRNVLVESARIARGPVLNIADANPIDYDAVIIPGGFGAAKNLSDFAVKGSEGNINEDVKSFLVSFHKLNKPIGAICIAPALLAILESDIKHGFELTIGSDVETAQIINDLGCTHHNREVSEICVDTDNKIISTPAYMLGQNIAEVSIGIEKLIKKVLELC